MRIAHPACSIVNLNKNDARQDHLDTSQDCGLDFIEYASFLLLP